MRPPCKECLSRIPLCHSICPDYKKWKEIGDRARESKRKENEIDNYLKRRKR